MFNISNKEIGILQAYKELEKDDQEIFYHKLKAAATEARKKAKENYSKYLARRCKISNLIYVDFDGIKLWTNTKH